jgi:hypothetical protein
VLLCGLRVNLLSSGHFATILATLRVKSELETVGMVLKKLAADLGRVSVSKRCGESKSEFEQMVVLCRYLLVD